MPLLSGPLPTAEELEDKVLKDCDATVERTTEALNKSTEALLQALQSARDKALSAMNELEALPEEISSIDDEMLELRGELEEPSSLLASLQEKELELQELCTARDYLSVLAKAEELGMQAIEKDGDDKKRWGKQGALATLSELARLIKAAERAQSDGPQLKGMVFARSQLDQAYSSLRKQRMSRLQSALEQSGWPPPPIELDDPKRVGQASVTKSVDEMLLAPASVRRYWKDLMDLQIRGAKLGLAPPPTALQGLITNIDTNGKPKGSATSLGAAAGSTEYEPILAIQCLLNPLLLRFYYHFDSDRSTNRLDKPEWFLSHMLSLLRTHSTLFDPQQGAVALLCSSEKQGTSVDTTMEFLHGLLLPLRNKVESSIDLLLQHPVLLSHTIMQVLRFDEDLRDIYPPAARQTRSGEGAVRLANSLLAKESVFEAWVQGERQFTSDRLEDELSSGAAWLVGDEADEGHGGSGSSTWLALNQASTTDVDAPASMKTTRSARSVVDLIDGLTARYSPLPSANQQLPFVLIQSSLLRQYAQRLERSLDAFESLSSAFARAIPGGMSSSGGDNSYVPPSGTYSDTGSFGPATDSEMVQGLRGLGRLLKACLSALFVVAHLDHLSSTSFFLVLGSAIGNGEGSSSGGGSGNRLLADWNRFQGEEEEQELDKASLGELVRRGWRSGGRLASAARPLASGTGSERGSSIPRSPAATTTKLDTSDMEAGAVVKVWQEPKARFQTIVNRSLRAMEKLVVGETLENLRAYSHREWDEEEEEEEDDDVDEDDELPTPTLVASLTTLSTHLTHLLPSLPMQSRLEIYRSIASSLSTSIVERVVIAGGSHRFSTRGAKRFRSDARHGWLGVVRDGTIDHALLSSPSSSLGGGLGPSEAVVRRRIEGPWKSLLDVSTLLNLPKEGTKEGDGDTWTIERATRTLFAREAQDDAKSFQALKQEVGIDDRMQLRFAREVLRRRTDCTA